MMLIISVKINNKTMTLLISVIIYTVIRKNTTSNNDTYNKCQGNNTIMTLLKSVIIYPSIMTLLESVIK